MEGRIMKRREFLTTTGVSLAGACAPSVLTTGGSTMADEKARPKNAVVSLRVSTLVWQDKARLE